MKQLAQVFTTCLILSCFFLLNDDLVVSAQTLPKTWTKEAQVTISASLGEPVLRLWGYGAPNSRIELNGSGVSDFTYARTDGYFEFSKAFLPIPINLLYPELCLTGIDLMGRATPPICIPPLPAIEFNYDIGPVILPPTLSLESGHAAPLTQIEANGITIPNSEVKIVLAEGDENGKLANFSLVREAKAYYIPDYTVKSDANGYFSFNMPGTNPDTWRVFAITKYSKDATSPKSNTLTFRIISPTIIAFGNLWQRILSLLTLPILIILEILVILLILVVIFLKRKDKEKVYPKNLNTIEKYQSK
jgi:hypothetical protein